MGARAGRMGIVVGSSMEADALGGIARVVELPAGSDDVQPEPVEVHQLGSVVVLGRHGTDGAVPPHLIDHLNHLRVFLHLGVDRVVAVSSVGSLRADWGVGTVTCPDDFFALGHSPTSFTDRRGHRVPGFDAEWRREIVVSLEGVGGSEWQVIDGGTYVQTPGPRFETAAEVRFLATVGDVVGMTVASEAILAGELEVPYSAVCVVDNLANGLDGTALQLDDFRAGVTANRDRAEAVIDRLVSAAAGAVSP